MHWDIPITNEQDQYATLKLITSDTAAESLFDLMSNDLPLLHIPRQPMQAVRQSEELIQAYIQRFQARQGAAWQLFEEASEEPQMLLALESINWMHMNARMSWVLKEPENAEKLKHWLPPVLSFLRDELGLQRIEVLLNQVTPATTMKGYADALLFIGFQKEGYLPDQQEFNGESVSLDLWGILAVDI